MEEAPDFVTVAVVYSQPEFAVLLSRFQHENIWVVPVSSGHASVAWNLTLALGGIELRVRREDAAAARSLLKGLERTTFRRGILSDNRLLDLILVLSLFFAGLFAPPARIPAFFPEQRCAGSDPREDDSC